MIAPDVVPQSQQTREDAQKTTSTQPATALQGHLTRRIPPIPRDLGSRAGKRAKVPLLSTGEEIEQWAHVRRLWTLQMQQLRKLFQENPKLASRVAWCRAKDYFTLLSKYDGGLANIRNFSVLSEEMSAIQVYLAPEKQREFSNAVSTLLSKLAVTRLDDTAISRPVKVGIIGGGAIGCYLAVRFAQAGARVTIVDRGSLRTKLLRQREDMEALFWLTQLYTPEQAEGSNEHEPHEGTKAPGTALSAEQTKERSSDTLQSSNSSQQRQQASGTMSSSSSSSSLESDPDATLKTTILNRIAKAAAAALNPGVLALPLSIEAYDPAVDLFNRPHVAPTTLRCKACARQTFLKRIYRLQQSRPEIMKCATAIRLAAMECQSMLQEAMLGEDASAGKSSSRRRGVEESTSVQKSSRTKLNRRRSSSGGLSPNTVSDSLDSAPSTDGMLGETKTANDSNGQFDEEDYDDGDDGDDDLDFDSISTEKGQEIGVSHYSPDILRHNPHLTVNPNLHGTQQQSNALSRSNAYTLTIERIQRLISPTSKLALLAEAVNFDGEHYRTSADQAFQSNERCMCELAHRLLERIKPAPSKKKAMTKTTTAAPSSRVPNIFETPQTNQNNRALFDNLYNDSLDDDNEGVDNEAQDECDSEDEAFGYEGIITVSNCVEDIVTADAILTCVKAHDSAAAFENLAAALTAVHEIAARAELASAERELAHIISYVKRRAPIQFARNPLPLLTKGAEKAASPATAQLSINDSDATDGPSTTSSLKRPAYQSELLRPIESLLPPRQTRICTQRLVLCCQNGIVNLEAQLRGLDSIPACADVGAAVVEFNVIPSGGVDIASLPPSAEMSQGGSAASRTNPDGSSRQPDSPPPSADSSASPAIRPKTLTLDYPRIDRLTSLATWTHDDALAATQSMESRLHDESKKTGSQDMQLPLTLVISEASARQAAIQRMLKFLQVPSSLVRAADPHACEDPIANPRSLVTVTLAKYFRSLPEDQHERRGRKSSIGGGGSAAKSAMQRDIRGIEELPEVQTPTRIQRLRFTKTTKGLVSLTVPHPSKDRLVPALSLTAPGSPLWNMLQALADARVTALCLDYDDWLAVARAKLIVNLLNSVNAASGVPLAQMLSDSNYRLVAAALMREAIDVFAASGKKLGTFNGIPITILPTFLLLPTFIVRLASTFALGVSPTAKLSMLMDLERGAKTEVEILNGEVVSIALSVGAGCDLNKSMVRLIHSLEEVVRANSDLPIHNPSDESQSTKAASSLDASIESEEDGAGIADEVQLRNRKQDRNRGKSPLKVTTSRPKASEWQRLGVTLLDMTATRADGPTTMKHFYTSEELVRELGGRDELEKRVTAQRVMAAGLLTALIALIIIVLYMILLVFQLTRRVGKWLV